MKIKKMKKSKKYYSGKNPTTWPMGSKSAKKVFLFKKKKRNTKLPWPMSAKSDTQLPGYIFYI